MTTLVKSPCIGCRFAEWDRTADGRRVGIGTCHWRAKTEPTPWWVVCNRVIFRTGVTPDSRCATCDAREEA